MDSGFAGGEDELYNVYDKPWRQDRDLASAIYRPHKVTDKDTYGDDLDNLIKSNRYSNNLDYLIKSDRTIIIFLCKTEFLLSYSILIDKFV